MLVTEIIRLKRDNQRLPKAAIQQFMRGYVDDSIPDYQAAALLMAIYIHGLEGEELAEWTGAMVHSGVVLDWSFLDGPKVDKHSSGGVGDLISIPLAPLVACAGLYVPMMAGRGLGHTGGTLDKLEAIAGYRCDLSREEFQKVVQEHGCSIIGQTADLAPADRKIYALRDVTGTVESPELIASSIMSKKIAEGIDALVLDIKTGSGAFLAKFEDAQNAADLMIGIGKAAGKEVRVLISDMGQPLGRAVGNANEIRESVEVLSGVGPADVVALTLELGAEMLVAGGKATSLDQARGTLQGFLDNGQALEKFRAMVIAQGGDPRMIDDTCLLPRAPHRDVLLAPTSGYVSELACREIGLAALELGAGRAKKDDKVDPAVGLEILVKRGDKVETGQPWCEVHWRTEDRRDLAKRRLAPALIIGSTPPEAVPLILDRRG